MSGPRTSQRAGGLGALVLLFAASCGSGTTPTPVLTGEPPTTRIPVIIDADLDPSDIAAMAIMLRDPKLDVRAITIDGTGLVHCQGGRLLTRYLLDELGSPSVPFGCGREDPGADGHSFPAEWRAAADAGFGFEIAPQAQPGTPPTAIEVLRNAVDQSPSAPTIVTLGPLTNLEDAFAADPTLADRLAGIHAMLGSVDAPGNVLVDKHTPEDRLEWNAYADPSAVGAVFDADVPISIVPLDATDDVPVPPDLLERLETDHAAAGADLVRELLIRNPYRLAADQGQQLWDELAALSFTDPDLVEWTETALSVGKDGLLTRDEAGGPARFAASANRAAVEAALLAGLRQGGPRSTPYGIAGELAVTFDGSHCQISGHSDRDGPHRVTFKGSPGRPSGVAIVGTAEPHTWKDVLALLPTVDVRAEPPSWLVVGPAPMDTGGSGAETTAIGPLTEGFFGPICFQGDPPDVAFTAGTPFEVGSGTIGS